MSGLGPLGKILIIIGVVVVVLGTILVFLNRITFFGKLPGDIHIEHGNFRFYFPVVIIIIVSLGLNITINLVPCVIRVFNKKFSTD